MRLTDEIVKLDDRKYRDRNVLAELKYMGREIKHRKTVTNDDLHFMAWLYRSALNLLKEQEPKIVIKDIYGNAYCPHCSTEKTVEMTAMKLHVGTKFCPYCGRPVKWE